MIWSGYLVCTIILVIVLMGLYVLIKKDYSWLDYTNVVTNSDLKLDINALGF